MNDPVSVGVGQGACKITQQSNGVVNRQGPGAGETAAQALSVHERHDVVQMAGCRAGVVQGQDVRMVELCGDLDLALKSACT